MLIHKSACDFYFIKGLEIIGRGIPRVSDDIIDDVIKFAKFSVADGNEIS